MRDRDNDARRERLKRARFDAGYKNASMAAEALRDKGLKVSTYKSHENGTRDITENAAMLYASAMGISFEWLWSGKGDMRANDATTPQRNVANAITAVVPSGRLIPVVGRKRVGEGGAIVIDGTISGRVECPGNLVDVDNAYSTEVVGDCMLPRYEPGELVFIHPTRPYHAGSYVFLNVRDASGDLIGLVKRYVRTTSEHVIVEQLNPPKTLTFDRRSVEAVHLIVGSGIR
ncbi:putative phage repressor [Methylobacterium nodulans ORS 2060]|uniref:Putative phage repressor n=2 Tax=Methylobacterium nodulans TaxID=114616 RepID=B8IRS1_METNO|nr:putative phage repressor [Methylobacterium nodulans ORS 2060]